MPVQRVNGSDGKEGFVQDLCAQTEVCRVCGCVSGLWLRNICWKSPVWCPERRTRGTTARRRCFAMKARLVWCCPAYLWGHRSHSRFCSVNLIIISSYQLTITAADHQPAKPEKQSRVGRAVVKIETLLTERSFSIVWRRPKFKIL